jgi:hypothetical protein
MLLLFVAFTALVLLAFSGVIIVNGTSWLIATVRHVRYWWVRDSLIGYFLVMVLKPSLRS